MFCKKCGSTLRDNAKFCGSCGAVVEVADTQGNNFSYTAPVQQNNVPYTAPVQNANKAPVQAGGRTVPVQQKTAAFAKTAAKTVANTASKVKMPDFRGKDPKKLLPVVGVAAVVVLVLILVFSGVFGGAAGTVAKAFNKTLDAYAGVANDLNLPDVAAIAEGGKWNQEVKFWVEDGDADLEGVGVRVTMSYNQSGKEAAIVAAPYFEGTDLITGQLKLDGSKIYFGCPELLGKTYIMVDTKTLGEDLSNNEMLEDMGMDMDEVEDLSFNIFDLIDQAQKAGELPKEQQKALEKAAAALVKALEVEKDGKDDIKVNGNKLSCTVYNVVIPQDAMEDFLDVLEDVAKDMEPEAVLDVMEEAGFPVDALGIRMDNDEMLDMIDEAKELVDELGDIEAQVAINKGYVVAVMSEYSLYGTDYELTLHLGGGDNYVDDLYLEIIDENENGFAITSSGNHAMKKGVFTDETVFVNIYRGDENEQFVSELSWEPKGKGDNFEWNYSDRYDEITLEGTLTCSKDSLSLTLPEYDYYGGTFGISYTLGSYKAPSIKVGNTMNFAKMDEDSIEELVELIEENAEAWAEMMEDDYEDLFEYIGDMLYYMF